MSEPEYERPQYFKAVVEPVVGMQGWSAQEIEQDEEGYCWFPVGEKNDAYLYGRVWIKGRYKAKERIREERDIIIANEELAVKEHTPVELSYQLATGGYQRVTETTPLPVELSYELTTGTFRRVGKDYPLPTTMTLKTITHATVILTAINTTVIVPAPVAGKRIVVHSVSYSNRDALPSEVALTDDVAGAVANLRLRFLLAPTGGNIALNLTDSAYGLPGNTALYGWLLAAGANGVIVNVGYTIEDV